MSAVFKMACIHICHATTLLHHDYPSLWSSFPWFYSMFNKQMNLWSNVYFFVNSFSVVVAAKR